MSIHKTIQKRTTKVRDTILNEWYSIWLQFIIDNLDKDWDWDYISINPNLTMKFIIDHPDKHWDCSKFL